MMFTARQGVWEAQSARAWGKLCSEVNVGFAQLAQVESVLTEVAPEDVDEFTAVVLEVAFGSDQMELWGVQVQDQRS